MKANEIVKDIMEKQHLKNAQLGARIGVKNDAIFARLTQKNISVDILNQMLAAMDYEIVVQPKSLGRRPEGCYVIDRGESK